MTHVSEGGPGGDPKAFGGNLGVATAETQLGSPADLRRIAEESLPATMTPGELHIWLDEHTVVDSFTAALEHQGVVRVGKVGDKISANTFRADKSGSIITIEGGRETPGHHFDYSYELYMGGFRGLEARVELDPVLVNGTHRINGSAYRESPDGKVLAGDPRALGVAVIEAAADLADALEKIGQTELAFGQMRDLMSSQVGILVTRNALSTGLLPASISDFRRHLEV